MPRKIKYAILFYGLGILLLLVGLGADKKTPIEENIKDLLLFSGASIISLYLGLTWGKPTYGGANVHKYGSIVLGTILGIYSIYLLIKLI